MAIKNTVSNYFLYMFVVKSEDKCQSKTLFLTIFDLHLSIILTFSIATYPVCLSCQYLFVLKMLPVYYLYCTYSNALKNKFTMVSNILNPDHAASDGSESILFAI